ncbi:MAG: multidrug transporter, partial [Pseudomonas sp.]
MIIGAFLILTWLVLLLRYPAKALPISLAAVCGLGLVALFVAWQDTREATQLARLDLRLNYAPDECPADRALRVQMKNGNKAPLTELRWRVGAYAPG